MKRILSLAVLAALFLGCNPQADAQPAPDDATAERKARILENLKFLFPQLQPHSVVMGDFEPSDIPGLETGSFVINGQQVQNFLVTADDKQLFLLASEPMDVSRTADEIAAAMAERKAEEARQARERHVALEAAVAGMPIRGNPDAPVTIVEFSDFQWPYCSRAFSTVETLLEKYPNDVKLVYLHYPLPNHPWAKPAAIASVCAAEQNTDAFWALHDGYFQNQRSITTTNVIEKSKDFLVNTPLDMVAWAACADNPSTEEYKAAAASVEDALAMGRRFGVSGTPGFFVNGYFLNGAKPLSDFEAIIAQVKSDL